MKRHPLLSTGIFLLSAYAVASMIFFILLFPFFDVLLYYIPVHFLLTAALLVFYRYWKRSRRTLLPEETSRYAAPARLAGKLFKAGVILSFIVYLIFGALVVLASGGFPEF